MRDNVTATECRDSGIITFGDIKENVSRCRLLSIMYIMIDVVRYTVWYLEEWLMKRSHLNVSPELTLMRTFSLFSFCGTWSVFGCTYCRLVRPWSCHKGRFVGWCKLQLKTTEPPTLPPSTSKNMSSTCRIRIKRCRHWIRHHLAEYTVAGWLRHTNE